MQMIPMGSQYVGRSPPRRGQLYRGRVGLSGLADMPPVPSSVVRDAKRAGFLSVVIPVKATPQQLSGLGVTLSPTAQAGLIGAGSALVKTKNPTVSYAAQGASVGASIGSVVPVIGTVIGAAVGAVLGAIGGAFKGQRRPESDYWDDYKNQAGKYRGIEYDNQYRNSAFVGLFRLGKNTFPPRQSRYGANDDKQFMDDMAAQIAQAVRNGQIGAEDTAQTIFDKVVYPWTATMGDWNKPPPDWQRWDKQILIDSIDAYIYDQPIVATSYSESRKANPSIMDVVNSLPQAAPPAPAPATTSPSTPTPLPAPASSSGGIPAGVTITGPAGYAVNAEYMPLWFGSDGKTYLEPAAGSGKYVPYIGPVSQTPKPVKGQLPIQSTPTPPPPVPPPTVTPTTTGPQVDVSQLVAQLQQQGATQQDAFLAALEALKAQGVSTTPQVQQQVADQIQSAGAGAGIPSWAVPAVVAAGVLFALARPTRSPRAIARSRK